MNRFAWLVFVLVAGCSSSSPAAQPDCFNGEYTVTFAAETSGTSWCPDLTSKGTSAAFVVDATGKVDGPAPPQGATTKQGGVFDETSCHASFGYTAPATGCTDDYAYDLSFVRGKSFTGTYTFTGCGKDATGAQVSGSCVYPMTGTLH